MKILYLIQAGLVARTVMFGTKNNLSERATLTSLPTLLPLEEGSKRIYLLRHGETDWNARGLMQGGGFDIELNERGRKQAKAAATELLNCPIDLVVSSHLLRSLQTADILHKSFPDAKRSTFAEFGEMRFGSFEGLALRGPDATPETVKQFQTVNAKLKKDINERWPGGGESTAEVASRTQTGLKAILDEFTDKQHIVVVAHGRTNKVILATLLFADACKFGEIEQGNTCINVIDMDSQGLWKSQAINYIDHIRGDLARDD